MRSRKVTVLMPVYNRASFVANAMQSIIDQTYENFEFLIVDDGSTDGTKYVLQEAAKSDKRIKLVFSEHNGISEALTIGNKAAGGNIIVKQDSDDISLPNRLEVTVREMENSELFYHGMYQTWFADENEEIIRRVYIPAKPLTKDILKSQYIPGCFAYTKEFIKKTPYRYLHCSEDWMLLLDAFLKKKRVGFINEGLYEYFLRSDSNSMIHENTGHYEEDEEAMRGILRREYGVKNFKYAKRDAEKVVGTVK